ncbi:SDR family NAD(P)-dependent oxidoreductase [Paenibacillus brevis]|uniref:SDR family NAD(P)-dependent oxidoreductase n=1 Tax=Paenibacillus brevis TaxID=2841508 RepID=A0ABS6FRQ8_9BACL|nr:SDR family NAD(P)-dependent oxidoreductase [Paenibacillus brevis]MBU5672137.1 SDR family NAD(P)-dependent oxidoreductase [Paenibacillus brevis]
MEKRTVIITGGNSGLGYQCAKNVALNNQNYTVVIASRNPNKANHAVVNLRIETGNPNIYTLKLDLASIESIRNFTNIFLEGKFPPLFGLVCNAGIHHDPEKPTKDGFESAFGVNHLGHYLLANLMLKQMVDNGRVVFVSSDTHDPERFFPYDTPTFTDASSLAYPNNSKNGSMEQYATSKLCNILCTYEMAKRLAVETDKQITVNAFNPGLMTDTNFFSPNVNPIIKIVMGSLMTTIAWILRRGSNSIKSGKALADMITESKYEQTTGKYYDRGKETKSSIPSYDRLAASKLWSESAELVHLSPSETILSIES